MLKLIGFGRNCLPAAFQYFFNQFKFITPRGTLGKGICISYRSLILLMLVP